ncbi:MAG: HAMP domain-containing histidine kinase [Ignavibacteriae bacterium]|nr:HAMP domain-containing histidine kinase [Ignavibacteriota bacterium]
MRKPLFKSLYWKISFVFLMVLLLLGIAFNFLTLFSAEMYFQEGNQRLHREFAKYIAALLQPYAQDSLDQREITRVFHKVREMNPSVEIYLVDTTGRILFASTSLEDLKVDHVAIEPIQKFLQVEGKKFTMGDDPRGVHKEKVFSAVPFLLGSRQMGYVYVILGGEEYDSALQFIQQNYILQLGVRTLLISLVAAALIGLVSIAYLTKQLRNLTKAVSAFGSGNLSQRIPVQTHDEIGNVAQAFNQMADTIQRHMDELAAMDSMRRELIANVSHDLRTPLSSMQGYIETVMMKNGVLSAHERQQYLQTILDSTLKLNKLVQELFELSKLEAKQTLPAIEPFSLTELVQDVTQKFQPQAEKQGVVLKTSFEKDFPLVSADIGMIDRVLQNLIENALNYTRKNGQVMLELVQVNSKIQIKVSDTGCGIPLSELPHIFDRFYRARGPRTRSDGAGLGLAIVKKILELHGEAIHVESRENAGTTFTFHLPLHRREVR